MSCTRARLTWHALRLPSLVMHRGSCDLSCTGASVSTSCHAQGLLPPPIPLAAPPDPSHPPSYAATPSQTRQLTRTSRPKRHPGGATPDVGAGAQWPPSALVTLLPPSAASVARPGGRGGGWVLRGEGGVSCSCWAGRLSDWVSHSHRNSSAATFKGP